MVSILSQKYRKLPSGVRSLAFCPLGSFMTHVPALVSLRSPWLHFWLIRDYNRINTATASQPFSPPIGPKIRERRLASRSSNPTLYYQTSIAPREKKQQRQGCCSGAQRGYCIKTTLGQKLSSDLVKRFV